MFIQRIKIHNFKSIFDTFEIDFTQTSGLWKISGPVGAGKTTIGEAILFGLFGTIRGKNNTDLVSWGQKKGLVELWCSSKGHNIYISREFKIQGQSTLYVEVDGKEITFTNKRDAQFQLEREYYDVSRITLELLCIISFNNFKSLATLNTQDSKSFLDQVFGFYVLTKYADICKELKMEAQQTTSSQKTIISNTESQITKLRQLSEREHIEGNIEECQSQKVSLQKRLQEIQSQYKQTKNEIDVCIRTLTSELSNIKTLGSHKRKEVEFVKKGICPTCGSPIDQSKLPILQAELQNLLDQYAEKDKAFQSKQAELNNISAQFEKDSKQLNDEILNCSSQIIRLQEQANHLNINTQEIDHLREEKKSQEEALTNCIQEETEWDNLHKYLSSDLRHQILSSFIPLLNKYIQECVCDLQLPYTIEFNEQFKCNIHIFGMTQEIPISSLSTGQLKSVDMSIILGVLRTIMSDCQTNILFLDELFSNLDVDLRTVMCSVLSRNIQPGQTIFIISHLDMDDKFFAGNIKATLNHESQFIQHSHYTIEKLH